MAKGKAQYSPPPRKGILIYFMQRKRFVEHPNLTLVAQQSVTKIITLAVVNLVTPKAGAKHELLFKERATSMVLIKLHTVSPCVGVPWYKNGKDF